MKNRGVSWDAPIWRWREVPSFGNQASATGLLEAPASVWQPPVDVERHSYLEIRDRENRQLITVIELLSPSNKKLGSDRDQYLAKQHQLLSSTANLVEIDLLRGGPRMPWLDMPVCDYCVVVSRVAERPRAGIWPIQLRERLPLIPVPLRTGRAERHAGSATDSEPNLRRRRLRGLHLHGPTGPAADRGGRGLGQVFPAAIAVTRWSRQRATTCAAVQE